MFMNPSFQIVPAFKNSRVRSSRLGAGRQNKRGKVGLASPAEALGRDSFASVVQNEARSAIKQVQDGGQNSGDAGGTHAAEITISPFSAACAAQKKEFTAAEKPPAASKRCATAANVKPANNH
jgi:hypothetical protein